MRRARRRKLSTGKKVAIGVGVAVAGWQILLLATGVAVLAAWSLFDNSGGTDNELTT
jgi:hypothetical protein